MHLTVLHLSLVSASSVHRNVNKIILETRPVDKPGHRYKSFYNASGRRHGSKTGDFKLKTIARYLARHQAIFRFLLFQFEARLWGKAFSKGYKQQCHFLSHVSDTMSRLYLLELQTKVHEDFTITKKVPTRAFCWLKAPTRVPISCLLTVGSTSI